MYGYLECETKKIKKCELAMNKNTENVYFRRLLKMYTWMIDQIVFIIIYYIFLSILLSLNCNFT